MNKKKVLGMLMALSLTAIVCVGGTLAYLSAQSEEVKNTFTIGTGYTTDEEDHTGIFIDEEDVDDSTENKDRDTENSYKDMVPNKYYIKDPTVHMVGGSIESYVFVRVTGLEELAKQHINVYHYDSDKQLVKGVDPTDYKAVSVNEFGDGIYLYIGGAYANDKYPEYVVDVTGKEEGSQCDLAALFDLVKMDNIDSDQFELVQLDGKAIKVQAAAVQYSEEMTSYEDAASTLPEEWN